MFYRPSPPSQGGESSQSNQPAQPVTSAQPTQPTESTQSAQAAHPVLPNQVKPSSKSPQPVMFSKSSLSTPIQQTQSNKTVLQRPPNQPSRLTPPSQTGQTIQPAQSDRENSSPQTMPCGQYVMILADPATRDEVKLKVAQELSENFEMIIVQPQYPAFLEIALNTFIKMLSTVEVQFIAEYSLQQTRKIILEIIHRLPTNDVYRPYVKSVLSLMFKLLTIENEENALVCLRIIIELHKVYRPPFSIEVRNFLTFVKTIYRELPNQMSKILDPKTPVKVDDISKMNIENMLNETFTVTVIQTEKKTAKDTAVVYNLIPKASLSLLVLQELPIIVVFMFQLYKENVHQDVADFIPLVVNTVTLQATPAQKSNPNLNKEIYVEFMGAQIKTLSFLAYIIRIYKEQALQHSAAIVKGVLGLLAACPQEVAQLRKELLIAARHILATELRMEFVPYMDRLFDETILLGKGWTSYEILRPLAYSTIADLIHHVRPHLPLSVLSRAVHMYGLNVHDESLPTNIQTMSLKLLLNLVECIRKRSEMENGNGRELLLRMLEVFILKFKTVSKTMVPNLFSKCLQTDIPAVSPGLPVPPSATHVTQLLKLAQSASQNAAGSATSSSGHGNQKAASTNLGAASQSTPGGKSSQPDTGAGGDSNVSEGSRPRNTSILENTCGKEERTRYGFPVLYGSVYTAPDCRSMVKTLVGGVKTITWGCAAYKSSSDAGANKIFQPKEVRMFIRLMKWAMQALDIYALSVNPLYPNIVVASTHRTTTNRTVCPKEEKEVLEHFAGVFMMMHPQNFQEIFSNSISYMVERLQHNCALQVLATTFLGNASTSPMFATILLEYLLKRMEVLGNEVERGALYLRLFKLVFGSVTKLRAENEQMLRGRLHRIVKSCMDHALRAKDPCNYFLLLRGLFHSLGGGDHDLYQEFLPLLPDLFQGLNLFQCGLHKQHMKELLVELCLIVPVRLSSLLPHLSCVMDPLVSALNGSFAIMKQGLQTLDSCVNSLTPELLFEHMQPVRGELMQALWKALNHPDENISKAAFRVLGKFGGGNRIMMTENQKINFRTHRSLGPSISIRFVDQKHHMEFPIEKIVATAAAALMTSKTDPFYRKESWEIIKSFLLVSLDLSDSTINIRQLFSHSSFSDPAVKISSIQGLPYTFPDKVFREIHLTALTAMFFAATTKELTQNVLPTLGFFVSHYTMLAISQQAGPFAVGSKQNKLHGMDALVLVDVIVAIMGHEEKELSKPGQLSMVLLLETAFNILGSTERASKLPLIEYLTERMCGLCYEQAWYAKLGGCVSISLLMDRLPLGWVLEHLVVFQKAFLFILLDMAGDVSCGVVEAAKTNLEKLLKMCTATVESDGSSDICNIQQKGLYEATSQFVRRITSPNTLVREQSMNMLELLAKLTKKSVTELMEPHKELLQNVVPPTKDLLRHQPANARIGILEANIFCTTLEPRLISLDLGIAEHEAYFDDLKTLCVATDSDLHKLPAYNSISNLIPLRKVAYRALCACHYIESHRDTVFNVLYGALESSNAEIQELGMECVKKFISGFQIDLDMVQSKIKPWLLTLGEFRVLTMESLRRLSYLTLLFPTCFNEKLVEPFVQYLKKFLELCIHAQKTSQQGDRSSENVQKVELVLAVLSHLPSISPPVLESVCQLVMQTEKAVMTDASSPFRQALTKFLFKFPEQTGELFLRDDYVKNRQWNRLLEFMVRHEDGKPVREVLQKNPSRLTTLALAGSQNPKMAPADKAEIQYMSIRITSILIKFDDQWLSSQLQLVKAFKNLWMDEKYLEPHRKLEGVDCMHWKEPKLLVRILLHYFCHHPNNIDLLFQLLRALCDRYIPNFQFLRDFLDNTVAQNYTVDWKRTAFFRFIEFSQMSTFPQDLKAKILQLVLIPCFYVSFEKGEGEKLIGSKPMPEVENPTNCVSVFINQAIDPDHPFANSDSVRIFLLQFSCLLMEYAASQIHEAANKRQGNKLRRLLLFAWPCLLGNKCVDPTTRYHGHLLLSHIITKFAIHKRFKLQVFHSLLKAHAIEARLVVKQALDILTPLIPESMEDGYTMLTHWTKKIIVEEGHSMQQLFHVSQLIVTHYKVYFPVRLYLIQNMVSSMNRLGFSPNATIEHRKLAVELAEVIIKWDLQRMKGEETPSDAPGLHGKRPASDDPGAGPDAKKRSNVGGPGPNFVPPLVPKVEPDHNTPIERVHAESVLNYLVRLACQVNDHNSTPGSPSDMLSRRCVVLLKTALKVDVWPFANDLKLGWVEKVLDSSLPNYGNICTVLELLTYFFGIMKKEVILSVIKPLQKGISACISCSHTKVVHLVHALMAQLMGSFPPEPANAGVSSKHEELDLLYTNFAKFITDGLAAYEKNTNASPTSVYAPLMMLKGASQNNPTYIDRLIMQYIRVLQRLGEDHLNTIIHDQNINNACVDLLILGIDLVKHRVGVMGVDLRKIFIGGILAGLLDKSPETKVVKGIVKVIDEWVKNKSTPINQTPSLRLKNYLLVKVYHVCNKRFPEDTELQAQFLDIINFIYRHEALRLSELSLKLDSAFMQGLRSSQPAVRMKFFEVFDVNMRSRMLERILYIIVSQNWEIMGPHYWITQCIDLLFVIAQPEDLLRLCEEGIHVPPIAAAVKSLEESERKKFLKSCKFKIPKDDKPDSQEKENDLNFMLQLESQESGSPKKNRKASLQQLIGRHGKYVRSVHKTRVIEFLNAAAHLCHMDTQLAEQVWVDFFPRVWGILSPFQKSCISEELTPFAACGSHLVQKQCRPSALNTFVEALMRCNNPPVVFQPYLMSYLGKAHNLWHRMILKLEDMLIEVRSSPTPAKRNEHIYMNDPLLAEEKEKTLEIVCALSDLYLALREEDLWYGLWQKHAQFAETVVAITYETQGFFEEAQGAYEAAMAKFRAEKTRVPATSRLEWVIWDQRWTRCAKELNQWEVLLDLGSDKNHPNPILVMESSWRIPNWTQMEEALKKAEHNCANNYLWKLNLYRGYLAICSPDSQQLDMVPSLVESAMSECLQEWHSLPSIASHVHVPILQASQQIMELSEAHQGRTGPFDDMKAIVKIWFNRLPVIADDLSHWSDVFSWRQHHYTYIATRYENNTNDFSNPCVLGVHTSAQAIIHFGKIARKHGLSGVCLNTLQRIYAIDGVPRVDSFQTVRQQVKCYFHTATVLGRAELIKGLEILETVNFMNYKERKEMTAEFFAFKGMLLAHLGRSDEANKAFSASLQLHDDFMKGWGMWGDFLEKLFTSEQSKMSYGEGAVVCFLHAARMQNETKVRKYLAKFLWLLTYDDDKSSLGSVAAKFLTGVPCSHWLPWVPQLLTSLVHSKDTSIEKLLQEIGKTYPQAVYLPVRTMYFTLKTEQNNEIAEMQGSISTQGSGGAPESSGSNLSSTGDEGSLPATEPMMRCHRYMNMLRDAHPTIISAVEGICEEMVWFQENWYEEVLRQLRQGLAECYSIAFKNKGATSETTVTQPTLNFFVEMINSVASGMDFSTAESATSAIASCESLAARARATAHCSIFQSLKVQLIYDFDFTEPDSTKLHSLILKIHKWIRILETKMKMIPKSFLIEDKCRFLSSFTLQTAEIEIPGEFLLPKHSLYFIKIARFMPRVDIVAKHNSAARRLYIKGHNGKNYPYLVVSCEPNEARSEERVLQLIRLLNQYLAKRKETSRRFLQYSVPRVVPVSPNLRLIEDNVSSLSLLDVFKQILLEMAKEPDETISLYYKRVDTHQSRGLPVGNVILKQIMQELQFTTVPRYVFRDWAVRTFPGATDYWTFRKMLTMQLSMAAFSEYVLHLTCLYPQMMYLYLDSGFLTVSFFRFNVDGTSGNLESSRPVPFRLTPNLSFFVGPIGITGSMTSCMIAVARCFVQPTFRVHSILKTILRDEMYAFHRKKPEAGTGAEDVINSVVTSAAAIMTRLQSVGILNVAESKSSGNVKASTLLASAMDVNNLCQMDPAWHPWF